LDIAAEVINDHQSPTQASPTMSSKSFVKDVVQCLEIATPKSGGADAAGPSPSNTVSK